MGSKQTQWAWEQLRLSDLETRQKDERENRPQRHSRYYADYQQAYNEFRKKKVCTSKKTFWRGKKGMKMKTFWKTWICIFKTDKTICDKIQKSNPEILSTKYKKIKGRCCSAHLYSQHLGNRGRVVSELKAIAKKN